MYDFDTSLQIAVELERAYLVKNAHASFTSKDYNKARYRKTFTYLYV